MTDSSLGRVITAMVTPFTADGAVDYAMAERLAAALVADGSDGLVVCGTTGESPTLTWDEEYELFKVVRSAVGSQANVIAGTGSNATSEAIAATQKAAQLGLDGALSVVPYYNKPPQQGLYRHFEAIARACPDLPLMVYNIPGRTGQGLDPETVAQLARLDNAVALKDSSGSLDRISQIRQLTDASFAIYSGDDYITLPFLSVGATGVVSVASHLVGSQLQQLIRNFEAGNVAAARQIHLQLYPLFRALFASTNPIPIKAALAQQGWSVGAPRLPLCELDAESQAQLARVMQDLSLA